MINLLYNRLSMNHADPDGSWHAKTELCHRKICVWFADIHDFRMFVREERHNTLSTPLKPMGIVRSTERVAWPRMMRFASSARPCSRLLHWLVQQHWACCFCNRQSLPSATRGTNLTAFFNFYTGHPVCNLPSLLRSWSKIVGLGSVNHIQFLIIFCVIVDCLRLWEACNGSMCFCFLCTSHNFTLADASCR